MRIPATSGMVLAATMLALGVVPPANGDALLDCQHAIAKEATRFLRGLLDLERGCRESDLDVPGSCAAPDAVAVERLRDRLRSTITKRCALGARRVAALGFPGPCDDVNPGDGFTVTDLVDCIHVSHAAGADAIDGILGEASVAGPLPASLRTCQRAIGRAGIRFASGVLSAVQQCREDILRGRIIGVPPASCATEHKRTRSIIEDREQLFRDTVAAYCAPADLVALHVCAPMPTGDAVGCLITAIRRLLDDPVATDPPDLIDYEYATPGVCGDNRQNRVAEDCDGSDDSACPGQCGAPNGGFGCMCLNVPRLRVAEHAHADLDLGVSGHDFRVSDGGGYVVDLWDCDQAPDPECNLGPRCSLPPHLSCGSSLGAPYTHGDDLCASLGSGFCRATPAAVTGPHCEIDYKQECATNAQCPTPGDRCVTVPHAPPLPLAQGGVSVCIESTFTEDVTGTTNLETGAGAVRARQRLTFHPGGALDQPCPVCGGFCAGPGASQTSPGPRSRCDDDGDCPGSFCVTEPVCSYGPNADRPCRPNPPFGGATEYFGTPSLDCPPSRSDTLGPGLDLLFSPQTTSTVLLIASRDCMDVRFRERACVGGAKDQRPCLTDLDCPAGSCRGQCFCPGQERPNYCSAACVGGVNDAAPCVDDAECDPPNGFCHQADCRPDPSDSDSAQEGRCTAGPIDGTCSVSRFQACHDDAACARPACPGCEAGETCVLDAAQCFVNGTIERAGTPGIPERTTAGASCLAGIGSPAVNTIVGLPGPAAITQPETLVPIGF